MSTFSERFGITQPTIELQIDEMPKSLRNGLWDAVRLHYFDDLGYNGTYNRSPYYSEKFSDISQRLQFGFYRESIDDISDVPRRELEKIRKRFFDFSFNLVYEFIEFLIHEEFDVNHNVGLDGFRIFCNKVLEREKSRFRIAGRQFVLITDEAELAEVGAAISNSESHAVASHISTAAALLSQLPGPDCRNSIKESVSAVEAAVRFVTGKKTVGVSKPLRLVEDEFKIHPALRDGFEKIFAFSSDSDGVRHALMDESRLTQADAKFMLIACSAFSNYLLTLKSEQQ